MSSLFGWGGVKIAGVEFANAFGKLSFQREDVRNITIGKKIILHPQGWRPIIDCELFNMDDEYGFKFRQLADSIALSQYEQTPLDIYPRYTSTDDGSLIYYSCFIDSDFAPYDIAQVDVGQKITLRFIGVDLVTSLPSNLSNPDIVIRVTDEADDTAFRITDETDTNQRRASELGA